MLGFQVETITPDADDPLGGVINVTGSDFDPVQIINFMNPLRPQRVHKLVGEALAELTENADQLQVVSAELLILLKLYAGVVYIRVLYQPKFMYTANIGTNNISAFSINSGGSLAFLANYNAGNSCRFVTVHPGGRYIYAANHGSSNISILEINQTTGALTTLVSSPAATATNPYSLAIDPQGRFLFVGHENTTVAAVSAYTVNAATGELTQVVGSPFTVASAPAIASPASVHVDFTGQFLYAGSTQSAPEPNSLAFSIDQNTGALTQISGSPFGAIQDAISVYVHPSGNFVYYAQYFAPQGVVGYARNTTSGSLSLIGGSPFAAGAAPGFVTGDAQGRFVYVANSGDTSLTAGISAFQVAADGALVAINGSPFASGLNPIGFAIDETSRYAYAANQQSANTTAYAVDASTGALSVISGSPYATGTNPTTIAIAGSNP
ncbi:lactonase family protein [Turneriella parva]|nr:beta-propeller fold lactonase family protein [Turneriella parva]